MGFISTSSKHRKYQMVAQMIAVIFVIYDLRNGNVIKAAFEDASAISAFLWIGSIWILLGMVSLPMMMPQFYRAGGQPWTEGGREQFAHAGGFTASFYATLIIEVLVIFMYPNIRLRLHLASINNGIAIGLLCVGLSAITSYIISMIIFRKARWTNK